MRVQDEQMFRGQRADNDEWVYGELSKRRCGSNEVCVIKVNVIDGAWKEYWVKPETVGEYTQYKDRNGVKIFKGDILQCRDLDNNKDFYAIAIKEHYSDWSQWALLRINENHVNLDITKWVNSKNSNIYADVVGNVYGSPELMKFLN